MNRPNIALESPLGSFVIGDLNAKCTNWWNEGTDNLCDSELYNMTTLLGFSQLINTSTNFEPNKTPSCIDLVFASQPNLVFESGIHPSLYKMCHHQIIYAKLSLKIHFSTSYKQEVWHYNRAQVGLIKKSIANFDWNRAFANLSVNDQVELLENTLLNIFRNDIPHETVKCSHKDPPWLNKEIKSALRYKNRLYKKYISGGRKQEDGINLCNNTNFVSNLIATTKESYFSNLGERLNDPKTGPKHIGLS